MLWLVELLYRHFRQGESTSREEKSTCLATNPASYCYCRSKASLRKRREWFELSASRPDRSIACWRLTTPLRPEQALDLFRLKARCGKNSPFSNVPSSHAHAGVASRV